MRAAERERKRAKERVRVGQKREREREKYDRRRSVREPRGARNITSDREWLRLYGVRRRRRVVHFDLGIGHPPYGIGSVSTVKSGTEKEKQEERKNGGVACTGAAQLRAPCRRTGRPGTSTNDRRLAEQTPYRRHDTSPIRAEREARASARARACVRACIAGGRRTFATFSDFRTV